jgi:hypothetical protein
MSFVGALIVRRHPNMRWLLAAGRFCLSYRVCRCAARTHHARLVLPAGGRQMAAGWSWYPGTSLTFIVLPAVFDEGFSPKWKRFAVRRAFPSSFGSR